MKLVLRSAVSVCAFAPLEARMRVELVLTERYRGCLGRLFRDGIINLQGEALDGGGRSSFVFILLLTLEHGFTHYQGERSWMICLV